MPVPASRPPPQSTRRVHALERHALHAVDAIQCVHQLRRGLLVAERGPVRQLDRQALFRRPDRHQMPRHQVGVEDRRQQRRRIVPEREANIQQERIVADGRGNDALAHHERREGDHAQAAQRESRMSGADRHPDRDREDHVGGVLRIANDGTEPDDRERADQAERARDIVADHLRHHRDQNRRAGPA